MSVQKVSYFIPPPKPSLFRFMWGIFGASVALLIVLSVWVASEGEKSWAKYSAENHCRMTSQVESRVIFNTGKVGSFVVPSQTTYACDGGVTITR